MCFTNTPASIKVVAAFCFGINMFNLIYLFMRYNELLPKDAQKVRREIESVMPDVKNLDKYMTPRQGTILVSSLAGISILFDSILFLGVGYEQPSMILSAWTWGVIDCAFDFAIGIASANMTFMDEYRKTQEYTATQPGGPPVGNATEYAMAPVTVAPKNDHDAHRLGAGQLTLLLLYVLLRLSFKVVALAGIKHFASHVATVRQYPDYPTLSVPDYSASASRMDERITASSIVALTADMTPTAAPSGTLPPLAGPRPAPHVPPAALQPTPVQPHLGITPFAPPRPGILPGIRPTPPHLGITPLAPPPPGFLPWITPTPPHHGITPDAPPLPGILPGIRPTSPHLGITPLATPPPGFLPGITPTPPHLGITPAAPPLSGILPGITPTLPGQDFPLPPVPPQQPPYPVQNPVRPP
ncbi:uncharacterized protein LOC144166658 [Haemaphysalis longicornis]